MALSPTNITKIGSEILEGVTPYQVELQIAALGTNELGATLTADKIAQIEAAIAEWDAGIGTNFADFIAKESNEGFSLSSEGAKNRIRKKIAKILERPDWANGSASDSFTIERG